MRPSIRASSRALEHQCRRTGPTVNCESDHGTYGENPYNMRPVRVRIRLGQTPQRSIRLDTKQEILSILDEVLNLDGRSASFDSRTPLLGALPELDSMAVVSIITTMEDRFDFIVDDDEVDGQVFETVGTLAAFIDRKLQ